MINYLKNQEGQIKEISEAISPKYDIAHHYSIIGAGIPASNNTILGPAVLFTNVKGYSIPVLVGLFGSRRRNRLLLTGDKKQNDMLKTILNALENRKKTVKINKPACQENIITKNINLQKTLPILTLTKNDAGAYITLGLVYAIDPVTGNKNISIHRLCIHGPDKLSIWIVPGRHLDVFYKNAIKKGKKLPVSINIGMDPAIYFASCFSEPLIKQGENELEIAGGIREKPVMVSDCVKVDAECISSAEIVLEGEITNELVNENIKNPLGMSMPEFLGYYGVSKSSVPVVKIRAITFRNNPIYQTLIGPGIEQSELLGIPTEISIYRIIKETLKVDIKNAYYSSAGGGQLLLILQINKHSKLDDIKVKQAGLLAISTYNMLKYVFLIDEDVNIYSHEDIMWAMTTRFQVSSDITIIDNLPGFPADPSQSPEYSNKIFFNGSTSKAVFDCTIPWSLKKQFKRVYV